MIEVAQLAANWFECYLLRTGNKKFCKKYIRITIGGVIVADPIVEKLNADFDVIVPTKLRCPMIRKMPLAQSHRIGQYIWTLQLCKYKMVFQISR